MSFVPPPFGDDVEEDLGPYSRDEIIVARTSLLHTLQRENSFPWRRIKDKLGILHDGRRWQADEYDHVWMPSHLPQVWSAPVVLFDPHANQSTAPVEQDEKLSQPNVKHGAKRQVEHSESEHKTKKRRMKKHAGSEDVIDLTVMYEVMYQCDLCAYITLQKEGAIDHLRQAGHHSASRYLGFIDDTTQELHPKYVSVASLLIDESHVFKEKIPACPSCHSIFSTIGRCLSHSLQCHSQYGVYSLRAVLKSDFFSINSQHDTCFDCGKTFTRDNLRSHLSETNHMDLAKKSSSMAVLICQYCKCLHYNYFDFKDHTRTMHAEQLGNEEGVTGIVCIIDHSQPAQHMLAKDPGIPQGNINYDFSQPLPAGDPGFKAVMTKSKIRRQERCLNSRLKRFVATDGKKLSKKKKKKKESQSARTVTCETKKTVRSNVTFQPKQCASKK